MCEMSAKTIGNRGAQLDGDQRYQIVVACLHCGAVDEFVVNAGREGVNSALKAGQQVPQPTDLRPQAN